MQVSDKHLLPNLMSWKTNPGDAWLAESVEHVALDLQVMRSSPTLGVEITLGRKKKKKKPHFLVGFQLYLLDCSVSTLSMLWAGYLDRLVHKGPTLWVSSLPTLLPYRCRDSHTWGCQTCVALQRPTPPHPQEQPSRGKSETAPTDHSSGNPWAPGQSHQSPRAPQSGKEIKAKLFSSDYNRHNSQFSNSGVQGMQLYYSLII